MARKTKKGTSTQSTMLDGAAPQDELLIVNNAAPAQMLHESRSRRRRALVWVFIIVGGLSIAGTVNALVNPEPVPEPDITTSGEVNYSAGKSVAQAKLAEWLGQDPSPLPGGYVISWDGFESFEGGVPKSETDTPANASELHSFTLATALGGKVVFYDASVLVSVHDSLGAIATAEPTLLPRVPAAAQGWSSQVWAGYEPAQAPPAVEQAAQQWAKAFTESADALRLYVGDEDPANSYVPLQGARVLSSAIPSAGFIRVEGQDKPKVVIARVELVLAWSNAADAKGTRVSYDVLVHQAHTASPKIVAWGPAGTGPRLEKYDNAVKGLSFSGPNVPAPTVSPPATPKDNTSADRDDTLTPADVVDGPGHDGGDS